jgi:hypothetical protein
MNIDISKYNTSAQAGTAIFYNESTRNLNYRIECDDLEDLKECVKIIRSYNDFKDTRVNEALDEYAKFKRFYNLDNPNNGNDLLKYDIAREGSVAMYIKFYNFGEEKYIAENGEIKVFTPELFKKNMQIFGKVAMADECDIEEDNGIYICRLWWD